MPVSSASKAELRPRLDPCRNGRARASAVTDGSEEPQVGACPAQAAGMMHAAESNLVPKSGRRRRAADGQQPVFVTTGEPARKRWRIMTTDPAIDGH